MGYSTVVERNKILALHGEGLSQRGIARKLGISRASVRWWISKSNGHRKPIRTRAGNFGIEQFLAAPKFELAYWAGFITADGNRYKNTLSIEISTRDESHLQWWCQFGVAIKRYQHGKSCKVQVTHSSLMEWLGRWGIEPAKTGHEKFPAASTAELFHWLRGLIDGDGYFTFVGNNIVCGICSASRNLLDELKIFLNSQGIGSHVYDVSRPNRLPHYKLILYERNVMRLKDLIYSEPCLARKWQKFAELREKKQNCVYVWLSDSEVKLAKELRATGMSFRAIGRTLSRDPKSIHRHLKEDE